MGIKKFGRNEKCYCGSGKKYKRCCLPNEEATSPYRNQIKSQPKWIPSKESIDKGVYMHETKQKEKYYPKPNFPVFDEPPQLIKNWDELKEYFENHPSDLYNAEVDEHSGHISTKDGSDTIWLDEHCVTDYYYLSTHTFYGNSYKNSTEILQRCGFNIMIDNWDKEGDLLTSSI